MSDSRSILISQPVFVVFPGYEVFENPAPVVKGLEDPEQDLAHCRIFFANADHSHHHDLALSERWLVFRVTVLPDDFFDIILQAVRHLHGVVDLRWVMFRACLNV